jgi:alpha-L-fucosidase
VQRGETGVINYKWSAFPEKAAVLDLERSKMDNIRTPFWQTDTAVSKSSWGYTENQQYKTPGRLIDDLVDIVSKNGCLLLNVGPRSDGTIPGEDQAILRAIGKWLRLNGEAIYGTRYWRVYGEGPTGTATGHLAEKKDKPLTAEDIRFTTKGDVLYAIILNWPASGKSTIKSLAADSPHYPREIQSVSMLGSSDNIAFDRRDDGLVVTLPKAKPCEHAFVLKIE